MNHVMWHTGETPHSCQVIFFTCKPFLKIYKESDRLERPWKAE